MGYLRQEWRLVATDRGLLLAAVLLLGLMGVGLANGWRLARAQALRQQALAGEEAARREQLAREAQELLSGQRTGVPSWKSPAEPFAVGNRLLKPQASLPPGPLAALGVGQMDLLPATFQVSLLGRVAEAGGDTLDHPMHLSTGAFDLSFVLLYLLPLLILALSFDVVSREREDGTLKLVLVQAGGLRRWVLGRLAVRALGVLALCGLAGGAGLALSGGVGSVPRLLVWGALVTGYVAFWFALALAVNALGRESATNALVLVGLWLLLVVVVPAAAQATVGRLYPLPSRVEQAGTIRQAATEANREGSRLLARYYEDHPELAPQQGQGDSFVATYIAVQQEVARRTGPVEEAFGTRLAQQQQALGAFRFLSPALAFQQAVQDVAGSSLERHQHFLQQVERFREQWREALLPRTFAGQRLGAEEHQRLPRFSYQEEPQPQVLGRAALGLLALLLPTGVLLALALRRLGSSPLPASAP